MTVWAWLGIGFGVIAMIETAIGIVFVGIPLVRIKARERRERMESHE